MKFAGVAQQLRVTAHLGRWLGFAFGICLFTGLLSHAIQHPPSWFVWPSSPVNLYRVTQGAHVLSGIASMPLVIAKVWSVYPKFFVRPRFGSLRVVAERVSIAVLVAAMMFELVTGLLNIAGRYLWNFFFPSAHYAIAWVAGGALLVHLAAKLPVLRGVAEQPDPDRMGRRRFLGLTWLATGTALVVTAGATVPWLRGISFLSWRPKPDTQRIPVNRTAAQAGVADVATEPGWRLRVNGPSGPRTFSRADLEAMTQHTVRLPIACVQGWSAEANWTGVRVRDLLAVAGVRHLRPVRVRSLERNGLYATSTLPVEHLMDGRTLLALRIDGEPLDVDHGYPCRIIAPSRPGVLQTKWVHELTVDE